MPDERPRPQYGEYATPEQQAAAMGKRAIPPLRVFPEVPPQHPAAVDRVTDPTAPGPTAPNPNTPSSTTPQPTATHRPIGTRARTSSGYNLFLTVLLLIGGVVSYIGSIPSYLHFASTIDTASRQDGMGGFPATAAGDAAGIWLLVSQGVLILLSIALSALAMRRHRNSFYIPLLGAVVFGIVALIVLAVTIYSDPAYIAHVNSILKK